MFQPVLPLSGLAGWQMLSRTMQAQTRAFDATPRIARDTAYFEARIGTLDTASDLTADRRLLRVALGAFGLQDDINNRYFIRKVLESDLSDRRALANALSDDRYRQLSEAFGFGDSKTGPRTHDPGFGKKITDAFRTRSFESAVGDQDQSLRLALNAKRELADIATSGVADKTAWFRILGTPPLRTVFETAFGLPQSFGQLDIDQQLQAFRSMAHDKLGINSISDFKDGAVGEQLIQTYLLRDQIRSTSGMSAQSIALALLQP